MAGIKKYSIQQLMDMPEKVIRKIGAERIGDPALGSIDFKNELAIRKKVCQELFAEIQQTCLSKINFEDWLKPRFQSRLRDQVEYETINPRILMKINKLLGLLPYYSSNNCKGIIVKDDCVIICFYKKTKLTSRN